VNAAGAAARGFSAAAVLAAVAVTGAAARLGDSPQVRVATTGNDSERVRTLPITREPGREERVVMTMAPGTLPDLAAGDRLRLTAELQVTNNCNFRSPRCVGPVYHYAPRIEASLVLARDATTTSGTGALPLATPERETCTQRRPDYEHHCVLVFTDAGLTIRNAGGLPCRLERCHVNLVAAASHPRARAGDLLMVGGQRPDGTIPQDRGRINAIRLRGAGAADFQRTATAERRRRRVAPDLRRRVVYSHRLDRLAEGEQLAVDATLRTDISHLRYAVRSSARLILADSSRAVRQSDLVKSLAHHRGEISENNGSNCTQDEGTCVYRKVGIAEMRRTAVDGRGHAVPLYVNLVTVFGPKVREAQGGDRVLVRRGGGIEVTRFGPELNR
jgi:hypothetical protein